MAVTGLMQASVRGRLQKLRLSILQYSNANTIT